MSPPVFIVYFRCGPNNKLIISTPCVPHPHRSGELPFLLLLQLPCAKLHIDETNLSNKPPQPPIIVTSPTPPPFCGMPSIRSPPLATRSTGQVCQLLLFCDPSFSQGTSLTPPPFPPIFYIAFNPLLYSSYPAMHPPNKQATHSLTSMTAPLPPPNSHTNNALLTTTPSCHNNLTRAP